MGWGTYIFLLLSNAILLTTYTRLWPGNKAGHRLFEFEPWKRQAESTKDDQFGYNQSARFYMQVLPWPFRGSRQLPLPGEQSSSNGRDSPVNSKLISFLHPPERNCFVCSWTKGMFTSVAGLECSYWLAIEQQCLFADRKALDGLLFFKWTVLKHHTVKFYRL